MIVRPSFSGFNIPAAAAAGGSILDALGAKLLAAFEARAMSGFADNDAVAAIDDLAGVGDFTQPTSGRRPVFKAGGGGSNPYLDFDGASNSELQITRNLDGLKLTIILVAAVDAHDSLGTMWFARNGTYWQHTTSTGAYVQASSQISPVAAVADGVFKIIRMRADAGNVFYKVNGAEYTLALAPGTISGGSQTFQIGTYPGSTDYSFDGKLRAFYLLDGTETSGERGDLEDYIKDWSGISF